VFDLEQSGNLVEAGFWLSFAAVLVIAARKRLRSVRILGLISGLIAVLFGISDLVEARTGAWWRPWWLLLWKAVCVTGLVTCFVRYKQVRAEAVANCQDLPQAPSSSM
jgi:hypothetical protein